MTDTTAEWPFSLDDPTRAVHLALEPDCPYGRPESCPREIEAQQTIGAYQTWLAAHPTTDDRTVIDGQPRETGPAAPQGPHSPSTTPEGPAAPERATQSRTGDRLTHRTVEYLLQTRQPDDTWEVSSSGTNTPDRAQERLAQRRQRMPQFEHRIAKRTFTVAIEPYPDTGPDSRTDSPDNRQDSTPDTETDSPVTSADTVRTGQDTQPMDPVHILGIGAPAALEGAPAEAERDAAYRERAHLLAWLAALHPANAVITSADDIEEPGWQLLYLLVGGWQMSWHIAPRDAELFAHVEHVDPTDPRAQWDGHSTNEKYERIREHTAQLGEVRTSTVRIEISPDPAHVVDAIRQVRRNGGLPPHRR
ncbi:hypothetical protein [Streptomyces hygroscopicus]|uniref:hypothetical protein n=1 Tax=Streptomyces hygroscopicus TaxID=1912 RepID=UPI00368F71AE